MNNLERLRLCFEREGYDDPKLFEGTTLDDLGMDSMDLASLAIEIEDEFQINLSIRELRDIHSVRDLLNILEYTAT